MLRIELLPSNSGRSGEMTSAVLAPVRNGTFSAGVSRTHFMLHALPLYGSRHMGRAVRDIALFHDYVYLFDLDRRCVRYYDRVRRMDPQATDVVAALSEP